MARVKEATPGFDGARLDDIVDYLTFVFVPILLLFHAGDLPTTWGWLVAVAVLLSSAYGFASTDAKTEDYFFTGFPSYWNIVALYLHAGRLPAEVNGAILLVLSALVFVRIGYVYPTRTPVLRGVTNGLCAVWGVMIAGDHLDAAGGAGAAPDRVVVLSRLLHCAVAVPERPPRPSPVIRLITIPKRLRDRIAAVIFGTLVVLTAIAMTWTLRQAWAVHKLQRGVGDTWFLAADGTRWFRMDEHRRDVPLADIPADLQHAFVAVEDHRFFLHPGVDPIALGRAVFRNVRSPGTVEGGSTLTQQLARTLFLSNRKSYGRKAREAVLALMIDSQLSKEQILELYLNRIYLSAGVYGVETMSQHLFRRPAKSLNLAECALVAGLARAPSALSPWTNLEGARARSHIVLARMRQEGFITEAQERAAKATPIRIAPYPGATDPRGGYAKEFLRQQFRDRFGGDHPPDWDVRTTFVPQLQEAAERAVAEGLRRFSDPQLQAALVAIDPRNGDILALVGGGDFRLSQFNRATRSRRQPGSAFKPLLYAAALDHGFSPVTVLDGLANIRPQGPDEWAPRNARGDTPDALTLRAALIESNNRAATALQQRLGSRPILRLASDAGLDDLPDVPSLSLGTGEVTPLDLTAAFAMFPNGGFAVRPRGIIRVVDADGGSAFDNPPQTERVLSAQTAYQMVSMLRGRDHARHRRGGPFLGRQVPRGREDRHHQRFQGRVVRRLLVSRRRRRLGRIRSAEDDRPRSLRVPVRAADLERLHAPRGRPAAAHGVRETLGAPRVTTLPRVLPGPRRGLPGLHRVLQGSGRHPDTAVPDPSRHRQAAGEARPRGVGVGNRPEDQGDLPVTIERHRSATHRSPFALTRHRVHA